MKKILVLLSAILCMDKLQSQPPVTFTSENIDFNIDSNFFTINGIYVFNNKTDKPQDVNVLFPFAVEVAKIESIRITNLNNLKSVYFNKLKQAISFSISVTPFDTTELNIYYRQPTDTINKYILTTTKSWGTALEKANYSLEAEKNVSVSSLSLKPDSVVVGDSKKTYFWSKTNFLPDKDFEVILVK